MSRAAANFRQADVTRALRAARAAGLEVARYEIDPVTGKIMVTTKLAGGEATAAGNDLDKWLADHARSA
jgi:hypothetical protein